MRQLFHGDCLDALKTLNDKSIDLVLTDPPYGTTNCRWDSVIKFEPMWKELNRIIKDNRAICIFGSEPFSSHLRLSNLKMFKYDWVWNKKRTSGSMNCKKMPLKQHELISVFYKSQSKYYPQMTRGAMMSKGGSTGGCVYGKTKSLRYKNDLYYPRSIIEFSGVHNMNGKVHPTQKPVDLLEYLIKTYTLEGETVLDFTMGSGSTGVACKNLNRRFIGIEKDENYFNTAKERINEN